MIKEIKYNGFTAVPSDYECQDGDLAAAINLIPEDGALKIINTPSNLFKGENAKVDFSLPVKHSVFIHKIGVIENFIGYLPGGSELYWFYGKEEGLFVSFRPIGLDVNFGNIVSIASVGYILIVSTDTNLYFIRYDVKKSSYVFLGTKLPDIHLDFALKLNFTVSDLQDKTFDIVSDDGTTRAETPDEDWETMLAASYNVSGANGDLSRDPNLDSYVTTDFIPFDSLLKFDPNVEYKLMWDVIAGTHSGSLSISVFGKRNGGSELEMIFWRANESALANTIETVKSFEDEWTDICYKISFRWTQSLDNANCGTTGNLTWYKGMDSSGTGSSEVTTYIEYNSDTHTGIMGAVNKFVSEQVSEKSRFIYPFYIRYALKLYDGSYAYVSEPVLMIPNSGYAPAVQFSKHYRLGTRLILSAFAADIEYRAWEELSDEWQDLISGIDLFVSQPIWAYDQGQSYDGSTNYFRFYNAVETVGYGKAYFNDGICDAGYGYKQLSLSDYIERYATNAITNNYVMIAPRSASDISKDAANVTNFYKIASIGFSEINDSVSGFMALEIEKGVLSGLVTRERLEENVLQYDGFKGAFLKEYNSRLHICGSSIILRSPAHPAHCANFVDSDESGYIKSVVLLATDDGRKIVESIYSGLHSGSWFYYPDSRANKAIFVMYNSSDEIQKVAEVNLKSHDFLNGAYWSAESFVDSLPWKVAADPSVGLSVNNSIAAPSTVYVSEVNCPFVFRAESAISVGARAVFALASAAKALSQGQFGQFPLYAFTTDGVWALEMNATGAYTARQPITRDVCINREGITQIDSAVLFPTDRGIMLISGSQTQCISDVITNDVEFDVRTLPGMGELHSMVGHGEEDSCFPVVPFLDFISSCGMVYDYPHQRIIIFNKDYTYAYVYSLKSKQWGMMFSQIADRINSYPEALAVDTDGNLVDFSKPGEERQAGLLVTRPLKLGASDVLKTIDTLIQRGAFRKGHIKSALYGSRDLFNWHLINSSVTHSILNRRGTPYKYLRIALVCCLDADENVCGCTVQFTPRMTNRLR